MVISTTRVGRYLSFLDGWLDFSLLSRISLRLRYQIHDLDLRSMPLHSMLHNYCFDIHQTYDPSYSFQMNSMVMNGFACHVKWQLGWVVFESFFGVAILILSIFYEGPMKIYEVDVSCCCRASKASWRISKLPCWSLYTYEFLDYT